ncbi:MAG: hypothetical protein A3F84_22480 [Candidatus Handelsmanbacteria bacterium RIFCSPLOWO2_12_FULL_64_10]|uniref:Uncharacterized protein n=1 Tax=Handelsmanbacteria sp. (strain RIFCSPLOWO2_12_FULL_64_10) TaxID=1817868 RepID=A0A1F6CFP4_HANXR|nr:MAG: hypothetical protein A3F84_22480 [Candidatus Handelsmanbacteria bacterium RIFCSPLOWO2_12_FULL_64_10]
MQVFAQSPPVAFQIGVEVEDAQAEVFESLHEIVPGAVDVEVRGVSDHLPFLAFDQDGDRFLQPEPVAVQAANLQGIGYTA